MPNYYAHLYFGEQVLPLLPSPLRAQLEGEKQAFQAGLLGPDPLLFYHPIFSNFPRATGIGIHRRPVRPAALRLREAVRQGLPYAGSYAAGFLCHFALDSRCHLQIARQMREQSLSHTGMEVELDRLVMLSRGLDPFRDTPLPQLHLPAPFYETVTATVYPGVRPAQFERSITLFRQCCRLQTRAAGTCLSRLVNRAGKRFPSLAPIRGFFLSSAPDPAYQRAAQALFSLLEQEVVPTAEQLELFFTPTAQGGDLGSWYDRDFNGQLDRGIQRGEPGLLSPI